MSSSEKRFLTPLEFAERLGISRSLCYVLLEERRIPGAFRVGQRGRKGKFLIPVESVDRFVAQRQQECGDLAR